MTRPYVINDRTIALAFFENKDLLLHFGSNISHCRFPLFDMAVG